MDQLAAAAQKKSTPSKKSSAKTTKDSKTPASPIPLSQSTSSEYLPDVTPGEVICAVCIHKFTPGEDDCPTFGICKQCGKYIHVKCTVSGQGGDVVNSCVDHKSTHHLMQVSTLVLLFFHTNLNTSKQTMELQSYPHPYPSLT